MADNDSIEFEDDCIIDDVSESSENVNKKLILARALHRAKFTGKRHSAIDGWRMVVEEAGVNIDIDQARKRWDYMWGKYKSFKYPKSNSGGKNMESKNDWPYFELFEELFANDPTLKEPSPESEYGSEEFTKRFIVARALNKDRFTGVRNSAREGWDDILKEAEINMPVEKARKKWDYLWGRYRYFKHQLADGDISQVDWPYYDIFEALFDAAGDTPMSPTILIPSVVTSKGSRKRRNSSTSSEDTIGATELSVSQMKEDMTRKLIITRATHKDKFNTGKRNATKRAWELVIKEGELNISLNKAKKKWDYLWGRYKSIKFPKPGTIIDVEERDWPYFNVFEELFSENLPAPSTTGLDYGDAFKADCPQPSAETSTSSQRHSSTSDPEYEPTDSPSPKKRRKTSSARRSSHNAQPTSSDPVQDAILSAISDMNKNITKLTDVLTAQGEAFINCLKDMQNDL